MGPVKTRVGWTAIVLGLAATAALAASCGTPAPGAETAFCSDAASVAVGLRSSGSSSEVSFLTTHGATVEDLGAKAPRAIRREVHTFLTGANAAIAQDNAALANTPGMDDASARIKAYCGITG